VVKELLNANAGFIVKKALFSHLVYLNKNMARTARKQLEERRLLFGEYLQS